MTTEYGHRAVRVFSHKLDQPIAHSARDKVRQIIVVRDLSLIPARIAEGRHVSQDDHVAERRQPLTRPAFEKVSHLISKSVQLLAIKSGIAITLVVSNVRAGNYDGCLWFCKKCCRVRYVELTLYLPIRKSPCVVNDLTMAACLHPLRATPPVSRRILGTVLSRTTSLAGGLWEWQVRTGRAKLQPVENFPVRGAGHPCPREPGPNLVRSKCLQAAYKC